MIVGIGTDIVNMNRMEKILAKYSERFLVKNLHELEKKKHDSLPESQRLGYIAKRFAGKEAVIKAFKLGIGNVLALRDIAIVNDANGAPRVIISQDKIPTIAEYNIQISLSDDAPFAVAFIVVSK